MVGRIWAEDRKDKTGSTFIFILPNVNEDLAGEAGGESQMYQKQSHQVQKRILAVDDEPDPAITCSLALEHYGFKVGLRK
ncbi:MAG: hypothetical protein ACRD5E_05345 [Nitrososphaeraceae archaeon]